MRQRLTLLTLAVALTAVAAAGAVPTVLADTTEPVLYAGSQALIPGVVYTGAIGNVGVILR